jgi:hypothetical protein
MTDFAIPEFISDPATLADAHAGGAVRRWLQHLGLAPVAYGDGQDHLARVEQLADALKTSSERIDAVLKEALFRAMLKRELLVLDPVPHETAAREQYIRLATLKHRYQRRFKLAFLRLPAFFPDWTQLDWPDCPGRGYDRLKDKVRLWERTWRSLVTRNPALELRERMEEAFMRDEGGYAAFGWPVGSELGFYEWLIGDSSHPEPDFAPYVSRDSFNKLCEVRALAGGWWYWKHEASAIVWTTDAEWKTVAANWTYGA